MNSVHETVSMNSDPNSDSKQCTELKLSRVHSAHTQGPRPCAHCAQALRIALCRSAHWAVSRPVSQRLLCLVTTRERYRVVSQPPCHDTKIVSRYTPVVRSRARALPLSPARKPAMSRVLLVFSQRLGAVSQCHAARPCSAVSHPLARV